MKKSLTVLFLLGLIPLARAQQIYLIPKAGVSIHNLQGAGNQQPIENHSNVGMMAGAALEIGLSKNNHWAFQPEVLWVQKGCKLVKVDEFAPRLIRDEVYRINYLEIPLLIKRTFGKSRWRLFINAGPSAGIGIGGKQTYLAKPDHNGEELNIEFSGTGIKERQLKSRLDISLQAGGGITYKVGRLKLLVEGRYGMGFRSIEATNNGLATQLRPSHHRFLLLNLGIAIPLHKND